MYPIPLVYWNKQKKDLKFQNSISSTNCLKSGPSDQIMYWHFIFACTTAKISTTLSIKEYLSLSKLSENLQIFIGTFETVEKGDNLKNLQEVIKLI